MKIQYFLIGLLLISSLLCTTNADDGIASNLTDVVEGGVPDAIEDDKIDTTSENTTESDVQAEHFRAIANMWAAFGVFLSEFKNYTKAETGSDTITEEPLNQDQTTGVVVPDVPNIQNISEIPNIQNISEIPNIQNISDIPVVDNLTIPVNLTQVADNQTIPVDVPTPLNGTVPINVEQVANNPPIPDVAQDAPAAPVDVDQAAPVI